MIEYSGVAQSVEATSGGKRLRVYVAREGRANDLLMFPANAAVAAGDKLERVEVRPDLEKDSQGRWTGMVVYWVGDAPGRE